MKKNVINAGLSNIVISSYKDEPDMSINTNFFIKSLWERAKLSYYILLNSMEVKLIHNFTDKEINNTISVLKDMVKKDRKIFNVMKSFPEAIIPTKAHPTDTGYDLYSPIEFRLNPGEMRRIDFGIIVDIEPGYEIQVRNRSSVVWKYNTMLALGVGSVDESYRGTILAPLYNFGTEQMLFQRGDRLAQMVIKKTESVLLKEGKVNLDTERGPNGYGSSGK